MRALLYESCHFSRSFYTLIRRTEYVDLGQYQNQDRVGLSTARAEIGQIIKCGNLDEKRELTVTELSGASEYMARGEVTRGCIIEERGHGLSCPTLSSVSM